MISKLAIFVVKINSIVAFICNQQPISPVQECYPLWKWHLTIAPSFGTEFEFKVAMLIENWPNKLIVDNLLGKCTFDAMIMMIWNVYIILTVCGQISWRFELIRFQTTLFVFFANKVVTIPYPSAHYININHISRLNSGIFRIFKLCEWDLSI